MKDECVRSSHTVCQLHLLGAFPVVLVVKNKNKNPPANAGDVRDMGLIPESGRSPGGGYSNPLQFLPGESHGQVSLVGTSPWGHKSWTRLK